jgi:hypothetical protein
MLPCRKISGSSAASKATLKLSMGHGTRLKAARDRHSWEAASIFPADPADFHQDGDCCATPKDESGSGRIDGHLDLEAPLTTAWELAHAWPASELTVIETRRTPRKMRAWRARSSPRPTVFWKFPQKNSCR